MEDRTRVLGDRLRALRLQNDLTLRELGKTLGYSSRWIHQLEHGEIPPPRQLVGYAHLFQVDLGELFHLQKVAKLARVEREIDRRQRVALAAHQAKKQRQQGSAELPEGGPS